MVEIVDMDIFEAPIDILLHACNCFHTFGGLAGAVGKRFPEAYQADENTNYGDKKKLGTYSTALVVTEGIYVVNLYSQFEFGRNTRHTNYEAVARGLEALRDELIGENRQDYVLGIPYKMGCSLGGGDWRVVEAIIRSVFEDSSIKVLICRYEPGGYTPDNL